jgi:hypothetical protein
LAANVPGRRERAMGDLLVDERLNVGRLTRSRYSGDLATTAKQSKRWDRTNAKAVTKLGDRISVHLDDQRPPDQISRGPFELGSHRATRATPRRPEVNQHGIGV